MGQISRLKEAEISNGNLIDADDISAELNQLVSESNSQDTRLTGIESEASTLGGVKTFTSNPKMGGIDERVADAGITVDGVLCKDSMVTVSGTPAEAGQIGYASNVLSFHNGTEVVELRLPASYSIGGPAPTYTNASTVTFPTGLKARDNTDVVDMELTGDVAVSLASSGAGGLDAGTEASNTWYYFYLIRKSSDGTTSVVASATNESVTGSITYPTDYDQKRQLPIAVINNASSNIIPFFVSDWGPKPLFLYDVTHNLSFTRETGIVSGSNSTTWVTASAANYIPPTSTLGYFHATFVVGSGSSWGAIRPGSSTTNGYARVGTINNVGDQDNATVIMPTNSSQAIQWVTSGAAGGIYVSVMGWKWTVEV